VFRLKWIEVQIETDSENVEIVSGILYDLGVGGLAIEDPEDVIFKSENPDAWDYIVPEELLEDRDSGILVKAYFPEGEELISTIESIRQRIEVVPKYESGKPFGVVSLSEVFEKDWENAWKKYYKTTKIGERVVVNPSWEEYSPGKDEVVIKLDPGMAFGTGTHETTTLCARELEKVVVPDSTVLDVGCGSGILSIIAAKLGAKEVVGVDIDEVAVRVSKENIELNDVADKIDIRQGDLLEVVDKKYDIVVANILAEIIAILNKDIKRCLKDDGIFISSGIIRDKIDFVKDSMSKSGLEVIDVIELGEWAAILSRIGETE
jgi:ribosomal protein L11 methyltransferase